MLTAQADHSAQAGCTVTGCAAVGHVVGHTGYMIGPELAVGLQLVDTPISSGGTARIGPLGAVIVVEYNTPVAPTVEAAG